MVNAVGKAYLPVERDESAFFPTGGGVKESFTA